MPNNGVRGFTKKKTSFHPSEAAFVPPLNAIAVPSHYYDNYIDHHIDYRHHINYFAMSQTFLSHQCAS